VNLLEAAFIVLIMNLPFGYWRANVRTLSAQWFLAIHLPVVLIVVLRILSGMGWQVETIPALVAAFFAGQFSGRMLRGWWRKRARVPVTSCLVMDLVRGLRANR